MQWKTFDMKLHWVNHASFVLEVGDIKLISDPWIEGRVFNQSWELLSNTKFEYKDFGNITHIWFSHEHPDHFFPPNLLKIPKELRENISVIYQDTKDKKVKDFCLKSGFKEFLEIEPLKEYRLNMDLSLINGKVQNDTDSWLLMKTREGNVLNLNDCIFNSVEELQKIKSVSGNIDVLLTQFSYACWVGNASDIDSKKNHASEKLLEISERQRTLNPKYIIPFASYVWFCNEDNFHMNEQANKIEDVHNYINNNGGESIVLYPGDVWIPGELHNSQLSISQYKEDRKNINLGKLQKFDSVNLNDLQKSAIRNIENCLKMNDKAKLLSYQPMFIYLNDHEKAYSFSYKAGLNEELDVQYDDCDIAFHSQNLKYCFDNDWGYDTIHVAGTYEIPKNGKFQNFSEYRWIGRLNNKGMRMEGILTRLLNRFFSFLKNV